MQSSWNHSSQPSHATMLLPSSCMLQSCWGNAHARIACTCVAYGSSPSKYKQMWLKSFTTQSYLLLAGTTFSLFDCKSSQSHFHVTNLFAIEYKIARQIQWSSLQLALLHIPPGWSGGHSSMPFECFFGDGCCRMSDGLEGPPLLRVSHGSVTIFRLWSSLVF